MLRVIAGIVGVLGVALYGFFLYLMYIGWTQGEHIHESLWSELFYIFDTAIFSAGLPPLILTIYFMFFGKTEKDWVVGLLFIILSIPIHYYVAGWTAHSEPVIYVPMQLAELAAAIGLIVYWHKKYRMPPLSN